MGNLSDALTKYSENSSSEEIIKGLQEDGFNLGLHPVSEQPIFQNYLITLLNSKTNKNLAKALNDFSKKSSTSAKILNRWTKVLAFATLALVLVIVVSALKN